MLSPWDALPYFQPPRETFVDASAATVQLCQSDPMRVLLIFSVNPFAGNTQISLFNNPPPNQGMYLTSSRPDLVMNYSWFGPLVQQEWFAISGGSNVITVYTVSLAKWPSQKESSNVNAETLARLYSSLRSGNIKPAGWPKP